MYFNCRFCANRFCTQHQLPESHSCQLKESNHFEKYRSINTINYDASNVEKKFKHKHLKALEG